MLGFISGFAVAYSSIVVYLRYKSNKAVLRRLGLLSRQTKRLYLRAFQIRSYKLLGYYSGTSHILLHTSLPGGIFTDLECRFLNSGGEPILAVG